MKIGTVALCLGFGLIGCALSLGAAEEKEIPTEISEPPYTIGDLVSVQGYYIERADAPAINFRVVDNKIRIYWIDAHGLIAEPESVAGTVRFTGTVRGRSYHRVAKLTDEAGLGASSLALAPHIYNVILTLEKPDSDGPESHRFRYVSSMNKAVDEAKLEQEERSSY